MRAPGWRAHTPAMYASDAAALRGGVSRPSRNACTQMRRTPRAAASSTIAAICRSWLCTPPGDRSPSTCSAFPPARAVSAAATSTGLAANSPVAIAWSMRVKSW